MTFCPYHFVRTILSATILEPIVEVASYVNRHIYNCNQIQTSLVMNLYPPVKLISNSSVVEREVDEYQGLGHGPVHCVTAIHF